MTPLGTGEMFYLSWSQSEHKYCMKEDVDGVRLMANDQIKVDIKYVSLPAGSTKLLLNNVKSVDSVSLLQCAYGVVSDAPENTNGLKVGDEIICVYNSKWVRNCIRVPVRNVVKKPLEFNPEQAAVLTGMFSIFFSKIKLPHHKHFRVINICNFIPVIASILYNYVMK